MSSFRKALEDSYDEEMAAVYASASYVKLDAAVDMTITALSNSLDKDQEKLLNNLLNALSNRDSYIASNAFVQGARAMVDFKNDNTIK